MNKNEIVIFETEDRRVTLPVAVEQETVWLNRNQMAEYYNLDVIISVGYRVKSKRGVEFRRWANSV